MIALLAACSAARAADIIDSPRAAADEIQIEADVLSGALGDKGRLSAQGDVRACFDGYELRADSLDYDRAGDMLRAEQFEMFDLKQDRMLRGESMEYMPNAGQGSVWNADIDAGEDGLRAFSGSMDLADGVFHARDTEVTSCKDESRDWVLYADSAREEDEVLYVSSARLEAFDVPVMYVPYFPLYVGAGKKTGLLAPDFSYDSGDGGRLKVPYYFFLAENYDATAVGEWVGEHGFLLGGEFRYLTAAHQGEAELGWAPGGDDRARQRFAHLWTQDSWSVDLSADNVSDNNYFADFSDDAALLATRSLSRRAAWRFESNVWQGEMAAESFKSLAPDGAGPPDLLPQGHLRYADAWRRSSWNSEWEYARFAGEEGVEDGARWLWRAGARHRIPAGGGTIIPEAGFHAATYPGDDSEFFTPFTRLRAESGYRPLPGSDSGSYQMEAVFAYAPETRQEDAPLYDSALRELSAGGIYDWNRFSGGDRAADASVAALGASTRWWGAAVDRQIAELELVQRYYFREPRLILPDEASPPQRGFANLFASLRTRPSDQLRAEADAEWDPRRSEFKSVYADLRANFGDRRMLRIGGLFEENDAMVAGGALPLGARADISFFARHLWDKDQTTESAAAAVLRGECGCWNMYVRMGNVVAREGEVKKSVSVGFEFKGLAQAGENGYERILADIR